MADTLYLHIGSDDASVRGSAGLMSLLERLDASFLPKPSQLYESRESSIAGYTDAKVIKALDVADRKKSSVELLNPEKGLTVLIIEGSYSTMVGIHCLMEDPGTLPTAELRHMFVDLVGILKATFGNCHFEAQKTKLSTIYGGISMSPSVPSLYWLNYFSDQKLERLRDADVAHTPHASIERLPNGLLLQFGQGLVEATSPEGESMLIEAVRTLATRVETPGPVADGDYEEIEINGIRGSYRLSDRTFTISLLSRMLNDPLTDAEAGAVKEVLLTSDPSITEIHVNFIAPDVANRNLALLNDPRINVRYWDAEKKDYVRVDYASAHDHHA
jgi:hypothetical protein